MKRVVILVLLAAGLASGQSFEFQAGASNLYQQDGVQLLWSQNAIAGEVDLGTVKDHFAFGAGVHLLRRCDFFIGEHPVYFSTAATGMSATVTGVTTTCANKKRSLTFYAGATGVPNTTPYYQTATVSHIGAGAIFWQQLGDFKVTLVAGNDGAKHTLLEGIDYKAGPFHLEETAGNVEAHAYIEGQGTFQRPHFAVNASHIDLIGQPGITSEGLTAGTNRLSAYTSMFQSKTNGEVAGVNFRAGFLTATASETFAQSQRHNDVLLGERFLRRFTVSEFVQDGRSVNFGGQVQGNLLSGGFGYNLLYTPTGFQKALTVNGRVQLPRLTINVAVTMLPGSVVYWTGFGGMYLQTASLQSQSHMAE